MTPEAREYLSTMTKALSAKVGVYGAPREFEKLVCSCNPLRQKLEELESQRTKVGAKFDTQIQQITEKRNATTKPITDEIIKLRSEINQLDRVEHPKAEQLWRECRGWIRLWLLERLEDGSLADMSPEQLTSRYINDVGNGWRPRPPEKIFE